MKKCPTCARTYVDETLNFCLEDGAPLVFGPGADEPATAIMPPSALTGESPTVTYGSAAGSRSSDPNVSSRTTERPTPNRNGLIVGVIGAILISALGAAGWFYYGRSAAVRIESIAVMPFVNESGSGEYEYLSDGMTETLINSLSQLPKLSVKGRSSVFRYKGKNVDSKQLASELNVQAVLNGRVLQRGDVLVLSLDLVDAVTGNQIWGEQYNRRMTDLVSLQNEIARDVSGKLQKKLSGADEQHLAKNNNVNPEAFQLYLQGRFHWNKRTNEGVDKAIRYFQQAIEKDPGYALAYVGMADSFIVVDNLPDNEAKPKAKAMAIKALEIDPTLGEAHAVLGSVAIYYEWDWPRAEREYKRAIELSPNYATAHHWYGEGLTAVGRFDESLAEYNRAMELDPLSLAISSDLGWTYFHLRQYDRGIEHLKKLIELDPTFERTRFYLASLYEEKQMFEAAIEERQKGLLIGGRNVDRVSAAMKRLSNALATAGPKGYWQTSLELTQNAAKRNEERVNSAEIAMIYAKLGDKDAAFEWLENAFQERRSDLIFLKVDPAWDSLRSDPRFSDLVRRTGLPQ